MAKQKREVIGTTTMHSLLAGVALGLPVFHILEPEIKDQFDAAVYDEQVGIMEAVLDVDDLIAAVRRVRESG